MPIFIWNSSAWFTLRYSAYLIMLFNQWKLAGWGIMQTNKQIQIKSKIGRRLKFSILQFGKLWIRWHAMHIQIDGTHHRRLKWLNKKQSTQFVVNFQIFFRFIGSWKYLRTAKYRFYIQTHPDILPKIVMLSGLVTNMYLYFVSVSSIF